MKFIIYTALQLLIFNTCLYGDESHKTVINVESYHSLEIQILNSGSITYRESNKNRKFEIYLKGKKIHCKNLETKGFSEFSVNNGRVRFFESSKFLTIAPGIFKIGEIIVGSNTYDIKALINKGKRGE